MDRSRQGVSEAVDCAARFVREAPRHLWGVQVLAALGLALVFVAARGGVSPSDGAQLWGLGCGTLLVSAAPLWAGLYRLALGGEAAQDLGLAGLQFGLPELRLILLTAGFAAAAALVWLPVVAASALAFVLFRGLGQATFGALGPVQLSFVIVAGLWLASLGGFVWLCGRFAFAGPATVGERRLVLAEAWATGPDPVVPVLWAWLLAQAPLLLAVAVLAVADGGSRWPLAFAAVGGLGLGLVYGFLQAPLTVGVLSAFYRLRRDRPEVAGPPSIRPCQAELLAR